MNIKPLSSDATSYGLYQMVFNYETQRVGWFNQATGRIVAWYPSKEAAIAALQISKPYQTCPTCRPHRD